MKQLATLILVTLFGVLAVSPVEAQQPGPRGGGQGQPQGQRPGGMMRGQRMLQMEADEFGLLLGNGDGTFDPMTLITVGSDPIGIVAGIILFIPLANKFRVFNLLVYGAMVSAFALLPMALPWQVYGMGIAKAHYVMAILCMIILTVGEVLWSPKLYEYTAAIAPKGQEGTYLGLSMIPWFLAKSLVSWFSGDWLARWCPEKVTINGADVPLQQAMINNQLPYWQTPAAMWLILGVYALAGCLIAAWLRGWLTQGVRVKDEKN